MTAKIEIKMDNAAFDEPASELARILRKLAVDIERGVLPDSEGKNLRDLNGNRVGKFEVLP